MPFRYNNCKHYFRFGQAACLLAASQTLYGAEENGAGDLTAMPLSDPGYLLQVFVSLALVVAVIFALSMMLRKFDISAPRAEGPIRILHSVSIGGKEQLLLVKVGEEQILLGRSPGHITAMHKLERPITELEDLGQVPAAANLFAKVFNRSLS